MSFFKWNKPDENYGIDIDQKQYTADYQPVTGTAHAEYGDYEVLRRPTMSGPGGSDLIVPRDIDAGIPSPDDYVEYINSLNFILLPNRLLSFFFFLIIFLL